MRSTHAASSSSSGWRSAATSRSPWRSAAYKLSHLRWCAPGLTARATSHGEEVGADSEHARLPLDPGNGLEQLLPPAVVAPARLEIGEDPAGAFHGQQIGEDEPGVADLPDQLVRVVEGGGGGPLRPGRRVAVLPLPQIALDDLHKGGIIQTIFPQAVEERGKAGDRGDKEVSCGAEHPAGLGQGTQPVGSLRQVIKRTKQEDGVG